MNGGGKRFIITVYSRKCSKKGGEKRSLTLCVKEKFYFIILVFTLTENSIKLSNFNQKHNKNFLIESLILFYLANF